jgi:hypothetical protein
VKKSFRTKRLTRGEASALASDAWDTYLDLIGLALQKGFTLEDQAHGKAILKHPVREASVQVTVHADDLPEDAADILRKLLA